MTANRRIRHQGLISQRNIAQFHGTKARKFSDLHCNDTFLPFPDYYDTFH